MDLLFLWKSSLCMLAGTCKEDRADLYKSFACQMQRPLDIPSLEWVTLQGFYSLFTSCQCEMSRGSVLTTGEEVLFS